MLLEAAEELDLSSDVVESLHVIDRQVKRISRITGDLLVFSRATPMAREVVDLSEILDWSWSAYSQKARETGVELTGEIPSDVMVMGDAGGLEQVFGNLTKNALDAMEESGGTLHRRIEREDGKVRVFLEDTGPGIPEEILPRILDPFFTTKKVGKGTGLGLAISYGILQELGGDLSVRNRSQGGAVFSVTLLAATGAVSRRAAIMPGWEHEVQK
jgi:histidine kinase